MAEPERFEPYVDERGTLVPIEFDDVPFTVRRVFTVTAPGHAALRGDHANAMRAIMVLVSGSCDVRLGSSPDDVVSAHELREPGDTVHIAAGSFIRYELLTGDTTVLVLCDRAYVGSRAPTP
ncbi:MAG: WxcM-like domain-containing protein [Microcella sp.]|nr:WxcM-like domain-containing protein [Microcella sp.]